MPSIHVCLCPPPPHPLKEELELKGIKHLGGPSDAGKVVELTPGMFMEHDHDVSRACWACCVPAVLHVLLRRVCCTACPITGV